LKKFTAEIFLRPSVTQDRKLLFQLMS
jgi:hypothetical protein